MPAVTPEDRQAGFKEIHVSMRDGRILPVRVQPIAPKEMFRMLDGTNETIFDVLAGVVDSDRKFLRQMNPICHAEIFAVSCGLLGLNAAPLQAEVQGAKKTIGRVAPEQL